MHFVTLLCTLLCCSRKTLVICLRRQRVILGSELDQSQVLQLWTWTPSSRIHSDQLNTFKFWNLEPDPKCDLTDHNYKVWWVNPVDIGRIIIWLSQKLNENNKMKDPELLSEVRRGWQKRKLKPTEKRKNCYVLPGTLPAKSSPGHARPLSGRLAK